MPRCYMVKKSGARDDGPPPSSPAEASVASTSSNPVEHDTSSDAPPVEYEELRSRSLAERSAAETEAALELLALAQSVPPLQPVPPLPPAAIYTVYTSEQQLFVPVAYSFQPANIYVISERPHEPIYHAIQAIHPLQQVEFATIDQETQTSPVASEDETDSDEPQLQIVDEPHQEPQPDQLVEQLQIHQQHQGAKLRKKPEQQLEKQPEQPPQQQLEEKPEEQPQQQAVQRALTRNCNQERASRPRERVANYECNECGKKYSTSSNLSRHKQTHRSLDSIEAKRCEECGKAYVSMPALAMHVLTHRMDHVCGVCGKQFSRPWLLRGHVRSHTGEKPYCCSACGKDFADRSNLRAHLRIHSPEKRYECPRCHKSFALKSYMNKHKDTACARSDHE